MKKAWLTLSALALSLSAAGAMAKDYTEIRFGVDPTYAPFESKAADGTLVGFDIELGNQICKELKVSCKWVENDFDGLIPAMGAGKFDGILSSLTATEARGKTIDFSDRIFSGPTSMVTKKGSKLSITDLSTLKGKTVGFEQGTIQETYAKAKLAPAGVIIKPYQNQDGVYADLKAGRLDASLQDKLQAELGFLKSPEGADYVSSENIHDPLLPAATAIGIKKGNKDLQTLLNKGIKMMHDDGSYLTIQKKFFGDLDLYTE